jgi:formate-dependent nitrite reductase membrane component NrfD
METTASTAPMRTNVMARQNEALRLTDPRQEGYYGVPMLKRPLWRWEIALYFFGEGISAGCYVMSTAADLFGHVRHRRMVKLARYVSLATMMPCPPLLIADLGRPERFLHMLRVVKRMSPMNVGAWALAGFGQPVTYLALYEASHMLPAPVRAFVRWAPRKVVGVLGLPFALTMLAYPGVLLSMTSAPLWTRKAGVSALLAASSMTTAASAMALAAALDRKMCQESCVAIAKVEEAAHVVEAVALGAYLWEAGRAAAPLTRGSYSRMFWFGAVGLGLAAPMAIGAVTGRRRGRTITVVSSVLGLIGGLALKWAVVHAGQESALATSADSSAING